MLVKLMPLVLFHQRGDAFLLAAHGFRVKAGGQVTSDKWHESARTSKETADDSPFP
jgi:hypothetical protein